MGELVTQLCVPSGGMCEGNISSCVPPSPSVASWGPDPTLYELWHLGEWALSLTGATQ